MYSTDVSDFHIDDEAEFFFDNGIIESVQDLSRGMYRPHKVNGGPFLTADEPRETVSYISTNLWNVIRDSQDGLYKCWYTDWKLDVGS